ncbi:16S rRNA (guanine(527)-N(7))-methyltransferase RsmG [Actinomycetospora termitidis]|uniref:Ribosomal RNA small subunit methyltransferase G n=1 Tax=Actinomycetospora termitidis TaxID=3053470 RepID=A0ABT7M2H2_9PSEU|nr:16S rRNA (guanine(527)-N(7))-methyltransferase RsmG [Actinomycetospora sp. Odt1-22]MDL5154855.1 16S rRNA (guanine(527)-N(7))-methyltransferase RsmG [Actinomycetospora sp. Odt1-22]
MTLGEQDRLDGPSSPTPEAVELFGDALPRAQRYAELLAGPGMEQGVIGPRELPRLWNRHLVNSAWVGQVIPEDSTVVDVGSGAGLPGIPLALARPDLRITLLEPMARRVAWLEEVAAALELDVTVVRGRAEERETRRAVGEADVVTARAVAPMGRLAAWTLPLVRPGGRLAALKGASAQDEVRRDAVELRAAGGGDVEVVTRGAGDALTHIVVVHRTERRTRNDRNDSVGSGPPGQRRSRGRKDRSS